MIKHAKAHAKLGVTSMVGMTAMGAISPGSNPGLMSVASQGMHLANVGQLAKTGMGVSSMFKDKKSKNKCRVVSKFF